MSSFDLSENSAGNKDLDQPSEVILAEMVSDAPADALPVARIVRRRVWLPVSLFVATCFSTLWAGAGSAALARGFSHALGPALAYAIPVMTILICHEAGHFLQARRYGVYASLPFFIPMPISPIGTFGAVIGMDARMGHRRALFDIGITGPLAGLVPTLIFCVAGLNLSSVTTVSPNGGGMFLGEPLVFKLLTRQIFGSLPAGQDILLHPMAFAGWVGLLITALNLLPIGQLDGGHILYGLLRTRANRVASWLLLAAAAAVVWFGLWHWMLMLFLLMLMGPVHPPTADDNVPLGPVRIVLGWLTLSFVLVGFTPTPIFLR